MVSLTRRGWGVLAVVSFLVANAVLVAGRSINAVVMPLLLVVVAAVIAIYWTDKPDLVRTLPEPGFVGETGSVELSFDVEQPTTGVVEDEVGEGISSTTNRVETTVRDRPIRYDVTYERRGVHELGPATLAVTDVLGLASHTFEYTDTDAVLVYPTVYELTGATRSELAMLTGSALEKEREEFDRIREYESGDSLRDIHWKSSAKQPGDDLIVKEFVAEDDVGEVILSVEGAEERADEMAEAAASLAVHFLSIGVAVGMRFPDGLSIEPDAGPDHRTRLLGYLARVTGGEVTVSDREVADVRVDARDEEVSVGVGPRETTFESLAGVRTKATTTTVGSPDEGARHDRPGERKRTQDREQRRKREEEVTA